MNYLSYIDASSEQELLLKIAEENERAFQIIYDRYWNTVYQYALALTKSVESAEEITQDLFVNFWKRRSKFGQIQNFKAYLLVSSKRQILLHMRRNIARRNEDPELLEIPSQTLVHVEVKQLEGLIQKGVSLLSENQRMVYLLNREEGLSQREISERTGLSLGTVSTHMIRALNALREYLVKNGVELCAFLLFSLV